MSTELQHVQAEVANKMNGHQLHDTVMGEISFINTDFVSQKAIDIMVHSINILGKNEEGHGLLNVVFRIDGQPRLTPGQPTPWMFFPDSQSAVCNLVDCVELAFINTMDKEKENAIHCSLTTLIWKNILTGFFHESHHAHSYITDRLALDMSARAIQEEEKLADEYGREHMYRMAQKIDVEPELGEMLDGILHEKWTEYVTLIESDKKASEYEKFWVMIQKHLFETGASWFDPGEPDSDEQHTLLETFKEFCHFCSGDAEDDPDWNTPIAGAIECTLVQEPCMEDSKGNIVGPPEGTVMAAINAEYAPAAANTVVGNEGFMPLTSDDDDSFEPDDTPIPGFQGVAQSPVQPVVQPQAIAPVVQPQAVAPVAPVAPVVPMASGQEIVQVGAGMYPPINMDITQFQGIVKGLYLKLFNHIFQSCGYNPTMTPPFGQSGKIADQIPLTVEEQLICKEMVCYNAQGQKMEGTPVNGWLSGVFIDKANTLPGYELTLSTQAGQQIKRRLFAQNPHKKNKAGEYSKPALDARQGNQLMWIMDTTTKEFATRIYNGHLQSKNGYDWSTVA